MRTMNKETLKDIQKGDFANNDEVDIACAKRLLDLCTEYGSKGNEAAILIENALINIEVYI